MRSRWKLALFPALALVLWLLLLLDTGKPPRSEFPNTLEADLETRLDRPGEGVPPVSDNRSSGAARSKLELVLQQNHSDGIGDNGSEYEVLNPSTKVIGQCYAVESGQPVSGAEIRLYKYFDGEPGAATSEGVYQAQPQVVTTGSDGRFEIQLRESRSSSYSLDVTHPNRFPRTARLGAIRLGQTEDLGSIPLAIGHTVRGRVVDTKGEMVPNVYVSLKNLPLPLADGQGASSVLSALSSESGVFTIKWPVPTGTWPLDANANGWRRVSPDALTVSAEAGEQPVTIVVRRSAALSGVCVDQDGRPIAGVRVSHSSRDLARFPPALSDSHGRFELFADSDELSPIRLSASGVGVEPLDTDRLFEWGEKDVRLELARTLSIKVTVLMADSRQPVEQFSVICFSDRSGASLEREAQQGGHHPHGEVTIENVWRGMNTLFVIPEANNVGVGGPVRFKAGDIEQEEPVLVLLDELVGFDVLVSDTVGAPVVGSEVQVICHPKETGLSMLLPVDYRLGSVPYSSNPGACWKEIVSRASTDVKGQAIALIPPNAERFSIRVTGNHLPETIERRSAIQIGEAVHITVEVGGNLEGVVILPFDFPSGAKIQLHREDEKRVPGLIWSGVPVSKDGSFRAGNLPAGRYRASLCVPNNYRNDHGIVSASMACLSPDLGVISVSEGAPTFVKLNAEKFRQGELIGQVFLDDVPATSARIYLEMIEGGSARFGQYVPDKEGRFKATGLFPGKYQVGLVMDSFIEETQENLESRETIQVMPGEITEKTFFLRRK